MLPPENFSQEKSLAFLVPKEDSAFIYALLEGEEHLMSYTTTKSYLQEVEITVFYAENREKEVQDWFLRNSDLEFKKIS